MTDVLKIALERRADLHEEVAKLDEFIRMAEALIRTSQARHAEEAVATTAQPEVRTMSVERPAAVATDQNSVRTAMRRADMDSTQISADVARPSVIRRGQAAG